MRGFHILIVVTLALGLSITACQTAQRPKLSDASEMGLSQTASPVGHLAKQERLRQALSGLSFDSGFVEIDEEAAAQTAGQGDEELARERCLEAEQLLRQNHRVAAISAYKEAVLIAPEFAAAYYGLGRALITKGKTDYAIAAFRTALGIDPDLTFVRSHLALAHSMRGRWQEAIVEYRELLAIAPRHPTAHARLAIALYYAGDYDAAQETIAAATAAGQPVPPQLSPLLKGQTPGPSVATVIAAREIGPQIRIDVAGGTYAANETSIAVSEANPLHLVGSWNDWRDSTGTEIIRVGVGLSLDGGASWTDFLVRPRAPYQSDVEGDPMTAYDNRTGDLWVGGISFAYNGGVFVARKRPGETTFDPAVMAEVTGGADKGWMAAGPDPDNPEESRLYIAYNEGVLRSTDMGATWAGPVALGTGVGFLPRVGPNGELYVAYWDYDDRMMFRRSFNGGVSFDPPVQVAMRLDPWAVYDGSRFPGRFRVPCLNYLAVDPNDGTLYCVWADTTNIVSGQYNVDLYFSKSTNQGANWTTPVVINNDSTPPEDQFFPWLEVDQSGVLHLMFYDSRHTAQNDDDVHGWFDAYYSTSDDGGSTWTEHRLTPQPFDSYNDGLNRYDQFVGDYNGLTVAGGRVFPCYLDTQNGDSDIYVNIIAAECVWDMDGDGLVTPFDSNFVLARFGCPVGTGDPDCDRADIDGNGEVNPFDSNAVLANFGPCP